MIFHLKSKSITLVLLLSSKYVADNFCFIKRFLGRNHFGIHALQKHFSDAVISGYRQNWKRTSYSYNPYSITS
jgi:hypothetical protein